MSADDGEDQEAAGPQENGHARGSELDEEALPSTLFFGVRGQQARTRSPQHHWDASSSLIGFAVMGERAAHQKRCPWMQAVVSSKKRPAPSCSCTACRCASCATRRRDPGRSPTLTRRSTQVREGEAPAYYNAMEAAAVADLASGVLQQAGSRVAANDLGVIATYRKQARAV